MRTRLSSLVICTLIFLCVSCSRPNQPLQGYVEGEYTYMSSGIAGTLFNLNVTRGQEVKKGDLLFNLDPQPETAALAEAKAIIEQMKADTAFAQIQLDRQQRLYVKNATDKASLDEAQTTYNARAQQLQGAKDQYAQAEWALQQKTVYAPISSQVFDTFFRVGEKVPANNPVLALLAPANIKILFYVPERMLSQVRLGQVITFTCDSCEKDNRATISYISPSAEYTPPVIYSKDTRYKLVYLIRADLPAPVAKKFHPGQPVEVFLHE